MQKREYGTLEVGARPNGPLEATTSSEEICHFGDTCNGSESASESESSQAAGRRAYIVIPDSSTWVIDAEVRDFTGYKSSTLIEGEQVELFFLSWVNEDQILCQTSPRCLMKCLFRFGASE